MKATEYAKEKKVSVRYFYQLWNKLKSEGSERVREVPSQELVKEILYTEE